MPSFEHKKKARLKQAREAQVAWPDIFEYDDSTRAIECCHGDRVVSAHIRQFESATEEMVKDVWGVHASTTKIVKNFENFLLGQLLDASRRTQAPHSSCQEVAACHDAGLCETCLRKTANEFARTLHVSRISPASTMSTPTPSRPGTPARHLRTNAKEDTSIADGKTERVSSDTEVPSSSKNHTMSRPLRIWALNTVDLQIYVTSAYIHLLRMSPASICQDTPSTYTSLYLNFKPSEQSFFPPCSNPDQYLSVYTLLLANDSQNLLSTENAGGSSIESEVLSFEVLRRIMPYWELSTMEMSTVYDGPGPITDYVARTFISPDQEISVSVTRIFGWSTTMKISKSALTPLLIRKLSGLRAATSRILPRKRRGMVLFIWVPDGAVEKNVRRVWNKLNDPRERDGSKSKTAYGVTYDADITRNVIVFVCVCRKESWMDLRGWRRVFGKQDYLETKYLYALTGDEKYNRQQMQDFCTAVTASDTPATASTPEQRLSESGRTRRRRRHSHDK